MNFNELFSLNNRTAIVTGGSQGIGFQIAEALGGAGAKIVIVNRREAEGKIAAKKMKERAIECFAIAADISKREEVERMVIKSLEYFANIDILVNCAGINIRKPILQFEEKEWDEIIDINLKGTFLCCQEVGKIMIQRKKGKIINISSIGALIGLEFRAPYCASKGGVTQLTKVLALEWAPYNVHVNAIAPGVVITPLNKEFLKEGSEQYEKHMRQIPLGRFAGPDDLSGVVILLASSASDYITGQTIFVDGGWTIW